MRCTKFASFSNGSATLPAIRLPGIMCPNYVLSRNCSRLESVTSADWPFTRETRKPCEIAQVLGNEAATDWLITTLRSDRSLRPILFKTAEKEEEGRAKRTLVHFSCEFFYSDVSSSTAEKLQFSVSGSEFGKKCLCVKLSVTFMRVELVRVFRNKSLGSFCFASKMAPMVILCQTPSNKVGRVYINVYNCKIPILDR